MNCQIDQVRKHLESACAPEACSDKARCFELGICQAEGLIRKPFDLLEPKNQRGLVAPLIETRPLIALRKSPNRYSKKYEIG